MKKPVKMDNIECQNHKTVHLERQTGWTNFFYKKTSGFDRLELRKFIYRKIRREYGSCRAESQISI